MTRFMQGTLREIDVRSILQLIELGQRTGELLIQSHALGRRPGHNRAAGELNYADQRRYQTQSWLLFVVNGQITYATDGTPNSVRLTDYLHLSPTGATLAKQIYTSADQSFTTPEYGYIWTLLENHNLTPEQARAIISHMIQETLLDVIGLHQGVFVFESGTPLAPQLCALEISPLLNQTLKRVKDWKQLYPLIQSLEQCPLVVDPGRLQESLSSNTFAALKHYADGNTSIRQLARYLAKNTIVVARAIYPYIQAGVIQLTNVPVHLETRRNTLSSLAPTFEGQRSLKVVCIDDSETVVKTVELILRQRGYIVNTTTNPFDAFSLVFRQPPDLILCDVAMPELDGYELCAMLRRSASFHQTPIIMLTGKEGGIDRVWTHLSGATDSLTKPFGEQELLVSVERYIGSALSQPQYSQVSAQRLLSTEVEW